MDRIANYGDVANVPNNGPQHVISPVRCTAPSESLESRIGRLECTVSRLSAAFSSFEGRSDCDLTNDLDESGSIGHLLTQVASSLKRIADHFDPPPPNLVGSTYIAGRLNCTTVWVADMARQGIIPASCVVQGTGNGKPWKFFRTRIDEWIKKR